MCVSICLLNVTSSVAIVYNIYDSACLLACLQFATMRTEAQGKRSVNASLMKVGCSTLRCDFKCSSNGSVFLEVSSHFVAYTLIIGLSIEGGH